ncbi:hypothetical protein [Ancylobacter mangrovi]|uniref:hypothetical protein n=1 Tax=Ancylobacter mangrovi TaxID=2972472 RepID=UPI00216323F6|nr:hypothetical protein [Ancylobacter mangrovi]MCS0501358.1 hypothetical protein [Ancylobacter mangrovi]
MTDETRYFTDQAAYDPDVVELMDSVLEEACRQALQYAHVSDSVRSSLARATMEGVQRGMRDAEQLVEFVMSAIPAARDALERDEASGGCSSLAVTAGAGVGEECP